MHIRVTNILLNSKKDRISPVSPAGPKRENKHPVGEIPTVRDRNDLFPTFQINQKKSLLSVLWVSLALSGQKGLFNPHTAAYFHELRDGTAVGLKQNARIVQAHENDTFV